MCWPRDLEVDPGASPPTPAPPAPSAWRTLAPASRPTASPASAQRTCQKGAGRLGGLLRRFTNISRHSSHVIPCRTICRESFSKCTRWNTLVHNMWFHVLIKTSDLPPTKGIKGDLIKVIAFELNLFKFTNSLCKTTFRSSTRRRLNGACRAWNAIGNDCPTQIIFIYKNTPLYKPFFF